MIRESLPARINEQRPPQLRDRVGRDPDQVDDVLTDGAGAFAACRVVGDRMQLHRVDRFNVIVDLVRVCEVKDYLPSDGRGPRACVELDNGILIRTVHMTGIVRSMWIAWAIDSGRKGGR